MKKYIIITILGVAMLSFATCDRSVRGRINNYMYSEKDTCVVRMTDVFKFEWDTMYVLNGLPPKRYEQYRPHRDNIDEDHSRRILFTNKSEYVFVEDEWRVSEPYEVSFGKNYQHYTRDSAIFIVEKEQYAPSVLGFLFGKSTYRVYGIYDTNPSSKHWQIEFERKMRKSKLIKAWGETEKNEKQK